MLTERERFGAYLRQNREAAGLTRAQLRDRTGFTERTIGRWESGDTLPDILEARKFMQALGVSPLRSSLGYAIPSIYDGITGDAESKRQALASYVLDAMPPAEVAALTFLIFWDHGSSWPAMLQMYLADAQVPLLERIGVASLISANYKQAALRERVVFPDQPQPDIDALDAALEASRDAVSRGLDSYTKLLVRGGESV